MPKIETLFRAIQNEFWKMIFFNSLGSAHIGKTIQKGCEIESKVLEFEHEEVWIRIQLPHLGGAYR